MRPRRAGNAADTRDEEDEMATGETGFDDVTYDLISVQYHSLKAGHDYGQYVRDAENAEQKEIADFFRQVMDEDSARAHRCHELLGRLRGTDNTSPKQGPA
jgi:hypothetical protein